MLLKATKAIFLKNVTVFKEKDEILEGKLADN